MMAEGEEVKCSPVLPTIGPRRQDSGRKKAMSRDRVRSKQNAGDCKEVYGRVGKRYYHNSIKYTQSANEDASDIIPQRLEPLREIGNTRQNMSLNEIDQSNERLGLKVKKIESSSRVPRISTFLSAKRAAFDPYTNPNNPANSLKLSPRIQRRDPKLVLCDKHDFPVCEVALEKFLENACAEAEAVRSYFLVVAKGRTESLVTELAAQVNNTEESGLKKDEGAFALRYDKVMKEVSINYRKEILRRVAHLVPELNAQKLRALNYLIELVRSKDKDVVVRLKKKPMHGKESISSKCLSIGEMANRGSSYTRNALPGSAGTVNTELKLTPLNSRHTKRPPAETAKEAEEETQKVSLRNYISSKPPALIKVLHKDYTHLADHEVNKAIALVNKFISSTLKNKEGVYDVENVIKMAKSMRIGLTRKGISSASFKDKENIYCIKEQISKYLSMTVNESNNYKPSESTLKGLQYRFFIGKGNNGVMVRSVLKQRWWWNYGNRGDDNLSLLWTQWCKPKYINKLPSGEASDFPQITNHFERHYHLSNKKAMFINLQRYYRLNGLDPFLTLPLTFHIREGVADPQFAKFTKYYSKLNKKLRSATKRSAKLEKNVWIIKPGEYSNRGCGISIMQDYSEIKEFIAENGRNSHTYILQKYIEKPLLINKRKFDIRMYGMLTSINGVIKGYFYEEGYIRTSCKEYTLKNLAQKAIHLTNDAVQKKDENYGKYENGNKLSFTDFQKYLDANYPALHIDFFRDLLPQIKVIPHCP
eukprot:TRINITY_DN5755_c0_g1_i5.p1 TRINITY_DN5755_c0_g1~~TRINITY_DN5755_c0_g1_i5.p1  ORF type:complete len:761 (-),score=172.55 TRINITY_DN5755_c0_g1_i5:526-2808(-)